MKIIHIDSGLGNQMLGYCEFIAMKKMNPSDKCFIETLVYEIPECDKAISQWNGFELEDVFNLKIPNIRTLLTKDEYSELLMNIQESRFWEKNWNFSPYIISGFSKIGINLTNNCRIVSENPPKKRSKVKALIKEYGFDSLKYYYNLYNQMISPKKFQNKFDDRRNTFINSNKDLYSGQRFSFIHCKNDIHLIEKEIRESFKFPNFDDKLNQEAENRIKDLNSIAIHVRRGDMLNRTRVYYTCGYFRRSVSFMKKNISNPVFYFFCDPESSSWVKSNLKLFGLSNEKDKFHFIDWNKGKDSYKDMQLMSYCKHNIVTNSSFGWWGAFLNANKDKITCSPDVSYNTTHHF